MTDPLEALTAADPLRDVAPTADQAARMDAELQRLLAAESKLPPALATFDLSAPSREVIAAQEHVGPRGPAPRGDAARPRGGAARPRRGFSVSRWIAVPVVAAAAAVVALAAPDRAPTPLKPAPATAATVLSDLGRKVAAAPAPTGRYAYQRTLSYVSHMRPKPHGKGTYVVVVPHVDEQWIADDGTGTARFRMEEDQATFPTAEDKADYEAAGPGPDLPGFEAPRRIEDPSILGMSPQTVKALPTDPVALKAAIAVPDVQLTAVIGQLLGSPLTPVRVKAALFEVLKGLPGATLVDAVTDPQGRTGVGVRFQDDAWDTLFLFDRQTGQLLGTRSIGHKEVEGRDIDDWSLVLDSGRRDDAPRPTGRTLTKKVA
jgi:hypothetical protein